ncbi:MAG: S49 family peptidase [Rhodobacteraceae bacterium]|nr:S49 family peptidase [Paracoccaceae bacterium]
MRHLVPGIKRSPLVNVVRLSGVIAPGRRLGSATLNDASIAPVLERAFSKGRPAAVALAVNSPGGSPVQSAMIGARIRRLSLEKSVKVYAFCEDVAASGGYWVASSADEIYVDASSVVGSIGVISASFGFHGLMERYGVERRVHTAGDDKSMLDPFRPERAGDVERLKKIQARIHAAFIEHVKARRGVRLTDENLFTGEIWVGDRAVEVGLADKIGHLVPVMKEEYGDKARFNVMGQHQSLLARFGPGAVADVFGMAEDRALWARYGV